MRDSSDKKNTDEMKQCNDELSDLIERVFPEFFNYREEIPKLIPLVAGRLSIVKTRAHGRTLYDPEIVPEGFSERALNVIEYTYYTGQKFLDMSYDFDPEWRDTSGAEGVLYFCGDMVGRWFQHFYISEIGSNIMVRYEDVTIKCSLAFWIENISPVYKDLSASLQEIHQALSLRDEQERKRLEDEIKAKYPPPPDKIRP